MRVQVNDEMIVNAPASQVWRVLAHEFDQIGQWSSGVTESRAIVDVPILEGAKVGGRVCLSDGFLGGEAQEAFTHYDEKTMRFGYKGMGELPWPFKSGGNNWSVRSLDTNKSLVAFSAEVDLHLLPGIFMLLLKPIFKKVLGTWTLEELKYYVEHDKAHPRKLKQQVKT